MMKDFLGNIFIKRLFDNPIFVVGAARSGTSVLLQALGKHPLILSMHGEAPFITNMGRASYLFEYADNKNYYVDSLKVPKDYLYDSLRRIAFEVSFGKHFGLRGMVKGILKEHIPILRRRYWCAKTFPDYDAAKGLEKLYHRVKFVYIIRNGCDVVQSMSKFSGFRHQEFEKNCRDWVRAAEKFNYLQDFEHAVMVSHEQLVEDPEELFQNIFSFLGIDYHKNSFEYVKNTHVHPLDKPTQHNTSAQNALRARKPAYEDWTSEQREMFKSICGNTMTQLGYEIPF